MAATETIPEEAVKPAKEEIRAGANGDDDSKKRKREEGNVGGSGGERGNTEEAGVCLGGMKFQTSREMFGYFDNLISTWLPSGYKVFGKDSFPMLLDLVRKGHPEPEKMIGPAAAAGEVSFHVQDSRFCSRDLTFFLFIRKNNTALDFCFRSCINNILPLPEDLKEQGTGAVCACHAPRAEAEGEKLILQLRTRLTTSSSMFQHFFWWLYFLPLDEPVTENARVLLLELLKMGDPEKWKNTFGSGSEVDRYSFEVRIHPTYAKSGLRSFFLVERDGGSAAAVDFCFIKLIENVYPLLPIIKDNYIGPCTCHYLEGNKDYATLGPMKFLTSQKMISYFDDWLLELTYNSTPITDEVFRTVALDLLRKGYPEWEKKIGFQGAGQSTYSFQAGYHPVLLFPCYFLVREDGTMEPFCYLTCINRILPLPAEYKYHCCGGTGECCEADVVVPDDELQL